MAYLRTNPPGGGPLPDVEGQQVGALCYRQANGQTQVLLITSRETGRWVIPKGWPIDGLGAEASVLREAYEEAGVHGEITGPALGDYRYLKRVNGDRVVPCRVLTFPLRVDRMSSSFPERDQRRLKWFKPQKAAQKVEEAGLQAILSDFTPPA